MRCAIEMQHPLPSPAALAAYYEESYRDGLYRTFVEARTMKELTAAERFRAVFPRCRPGRWLDVGCSNGEFVRQARSKGMDAEGLELSPTAVQEARQSGLPVQCVPLEEHRPSSRYSTVTMFDLLEHVLEPAGALRTARELLEPGGTLALTLPDLRSMHARLMGSRWYFYIPEEHLHYFDRINLGRLLRRCDLEPLFTSCAYKPLTFEYSLTQFREYNPLIYRMLSWASAVMPRLLLTQAVPLYIGEMLMIARRTDRP